MSTLKVRLDRATLADAASWVAQVIGKRPNTPALGGIHLSAVGDRLTLSAFDYESAHQATISAEVVTDGDALLPGHMTEARTPDLVVASCGAGVQSTAILLLAVDGHLPKPDGAIFADTGWEPAAVYEQVDRLEALCREAGIDFYRVSKGHLRNDAIDPDHRYASIPYFVRNPDGSEGMGRRQCTSEYKLSPITRKVRELLGAKAPKFLRVPKGKLAEQWVGFSTDEVIRANRRKDSQGVSYLTTPTRCSISTSAARTARTTSPRRAGDTR